MVDSEMSMKIKYLRSKKGGEFTSNEFNNFFEDHGIKRHFQILELHNIMEWWRERIE
jgi:hypothetical protein